ALASNWQVRFKHEGGPTMLECSESFVHFQEQPKAKPFLTNPDDFRDVSRGTPKPFTLKGDDLVKARLTPETWRLEIISDGSTDIEKPRKLDDNTAIDLPTLEALGKKHGIKFLKAMQCLNISQ